MWQMAFLIAASALGLSLPASAETVIAAHRGQFGARNPENTLAAFREAVDRNIAVIEVDLRKTADGGIVVMHDATVDRTTNGSGSVVAMTLAQIRALDAGNGEHVPTFAEALDVVRGTRTSLLLDLKVGDDVGVDDVLELAKAHDALGNLLIGARSADVARAYRAKNPALAIVAFMPALGDADNFAAAGASIIRLWPRWIFALESGCAEGPAPGCVVTSIQKKGLKVWSTADAPSDPQSADRFFKRLIALGLDGILTDRPDLAATAAASRAP